MNEKITLDMFNQDSVSVKKQQYVTGMDGEQYPTGEPWRRAYVNSIQGRIDMQNEVAEPYKTAIMTVWGSTPTVVNAQ